MALITKMEELPEPECEGGYPWTQLQQLFDEQQRNRLHQWMNGQTMMLCEGRRYNHATMEYEESCNGVAHGGVVYAHDLERFLRAGPIID